MVFVLIYWYLAAVDRFLVFIPKLGRGEPVFSLFLWPVAVCISSQENLKLCNKCEAPDGKRGTRIAHWSPAALALKQGSDASTQPNPESV